jgi:LmbE family N-acetylglucosaminyl deacetylase
MSRRKFIKQATMGLGGLSLAPVVGAGALSGAGLSAGAGADAGAGAGAGKQLRVVCVGAHPGDPEFGCGGTMARYSDAGHAVTFIYLTRGEAYDNSKTFSESGALRTKEGLAACGLLKVKAVFAGQVDGNTVLDKGKNEEMSMLIMAEQPDLVFTQWPLDAHPDHQVTGLLALTTWIRSGRKFQLYFYEVNTGSETMGFVPTDYVDISAVREKKKAAMFAHRSQGPEQIYKDYFKTLEEFRGLEAGVVAAEGFIHFKDAASRATIGGF